MIVRQIAVNVVEALRNQPLILALVIINMIVLAGFAFTLHEVSKSVERKDALFSELVGHCDVRPRSGRAWSVSGKSRNRTAAETRGVGRK